MPTYRFTDHASGESWLAERPQPPSQEEFSDLISNGMARREGGDPPATPMGGPQPTPTPGKGLTREFLENAARPQALGAVAGAALGSALAPPAAPALIPAALGIAGAAGGGAAGELYDQLPGVAKTLLGAAGGDPSALMEGTASPSRLSGSTPGQMAKAGTAEGLNQLAAEAGISALKFVRPAVKAGAKEAFGALEPYMPKAPWSHPLQRILGMNAPALIPGQATEGGVWAAMRNIADYAVFNGGTTKQGRMADEALRSYTDDVAKLLGGSLKSESEAGQLLMLANREEFDARNLVASPIYNYINAEAEGLGNAGTRPGFERFMGKVQGRLASGERMSETTLPRRGQLFNQTYKDLLKNDQQVAPRLPVDVRAIKAMARRPGERLAQTGSAAPGVSGANIWDKVKDWPDYIDWTAADEFRKELGSMVRSKALVPEGAPARGAQKAIDKQLNTSMRDALVGLGRPDLIDAWDMGRAITRENQQEYNAKFINRVMRAATPKMGVDSMGREVTQGMDLPSMFYNSTLGSGSADAVRMIRRSVDKKTYEGALSLWMSNTIKDATDPATGIIVGKKLDQLLGDRYTPDFLDAAFGSGYGHALDALKKLGRVATFQQENASSIGRWAIQMGQNGMLVRAPAAVVRGLATAGGISSGAGIGAGVGGVPGALAGAATVFIGPILLGRMLTNPKLAKLIVMGASKPAQASGRAIASILARAAIDMSHDRSMDEAAEEAKANQLYGPALKAPDIGLPLQPPIARAPHAAPPSPR